MTVSSNQLAALVLTIHPVFTYTPSLAWALLSRQTEEGGIGVLGTPHLHGPSDTTGMLGYSATAIERVDAKTVKVTFVGSGGAQTIVEPPAGRGVITDNWPCGIHSIPSSHRPKRIFLRVSSYYCGVVSH